MEWISIFSNEWFTGIVCGIISGIVVYWITTRVYSRKQDKEYQQRVKAANNEILYTVRPLIVNHSLPSGNVWLSLIQATSRKYQVGLDDLYSVGSMRNDLIKEVLDNPFLDTKQKKEYTNLLESFDILIHKEDISDDVAKEVEKAKKRYQARADMYSWCMSLIAGVVAGVASKYQYFFERHGTLVVILAILFVVFSLVLHFINIQHPNRDKIQKKEVQ